MCTHIYISGDYSARDDIERAIKKLKELGEGFDIFTVGSTKMVLFFLFFLLLFVIVIIIFQSYSTTLVDNSLLLLRPAHVGAICAL